MCGHVHVEGIGQLVGVCSLSTMWVRGIRLGLAALMVNAFTCSAVSPAHIVLPDLNSMVATLFSSVARTESKSHAPAGQAFYYDATAPSSFCFLLLFLNKVSHCIEEASCPANCCIAEVGFELTISCLVLSGAGIIGLCHYA